MVRRRNALQAISRGKLLALESHERILFPMCWGEERRRRKFPWTILGIAVLISLILYFVSDHLKT